jgi:hypothetical protein
MTAKCPVKATFRQRNLDDVRKIALVHARGNLAFTAGHGAQSGKKKDPGKRTGALVHTDRDGRAFTG